MAQSMEIDQEEPLNKQLNKTEENKESNKQNEDNSEKQKTINAVRDNLINILQNTPVSELQFAAKAIVLDSKLNPKKAIETLLEYKIRAAPVIDSNQFLGVLDLRDTVKYALESYQLFKQQQLSTVDESKQNDIDSDQNEIQQTKAAKEHLLTHNEIQKLTLSELCKHRPFRYVTDSDSLLSVANLFAIGSHVVGVINSKSNQNELIGIITQGYFFGEIVKKWEFKSNCSLKQIFDLKYITSPIKSINKSMKASLAFKTMIDNDLSGLAVCNENGVIIHNTSATDIKLWLLSSSMLEDSIEQFLISVRNLSLVERYPVSTCQLKDTFKRAIQMLQATGYHRLWIVNQYRQPIGVLALTDIFQFICKIKEKQQNNDNQ